MTTSSPPEMACIYCHGSGRRVRERDERGWPIAWSECRHPAADLDELRGHLELLAKGLATPGKRREDAA